MHMLLHLLSMELAIFYAKISWFRSHKVTFSLCSHKFEALFLDYLIYIFLPFKASLGFGSWGEIHYSLYLRMWLWHEGITLLLSSPNCQISCLFDISFTHTRENSLIWEGFNYKRIASFVIISSLFTFNRES